MKRSMSKLLLRSFDCQLNEKERARLDKALAEDEALRQMKKEYELMRSTLATFEPGFSAAFNENTIGKLGSSLACHQEHQLVFRFILRLGVSAAAAVLILLMIVLYKEQSLRIDSLMGFSGLTPDDFDNLFANY